MAHEEEGGEGQHEETRLTMSDTDQLWRSAAAPLYGILFEVFPKNPTFI